MAEPEDIFGRIGERHLVGVSRCPCCNVANPQLPNLWNSGDPIPASKGYPRSRWSVYSCTTCGQLMMAKGQPDVGVSNPLIVEVIPAPKTPHGDLPTVAREFLKQAYETIHAPDAAAVMAGSAVDAMLKELGFEKGSLYDRIDEAVAGHVLTEAMGDWAHEVRLGSNRPRHADKEKPHVTKQEAEQSVEFAEALGNFLFVLTSKIKRGIELAKTAGEKGE